MRRKRSNVAMHAERDRIRIWNPDAARCIERLSVCDPRRA
jgi:hypothetical protein